MVNGPKSVEFIINQPPPPPYERDNGVCTRPQSHRLALSTGENTGLSMALRRPEARECVLY
jgi:hypothetical protein